MNISENIKKLRWQIKRDIARSFLSESSNIHLKTFPQMCCYSFDAISIELNVDGRSDGCSLNALKMLIGPAIANSSVIDIGANIGNHCLYFADLAHSVYSFEPHPTTYRLLQINTERRDNVQIYNLGASDVDAELRAVSPPDNLGGTAITERDLEIGETEWTFTVRPLDSFSELEEVHISLVKLDVEGHESAALRGAEGLIQKNRPFLLIEQNLDGIKNGTSEAVELIRNFGYSHIYSIDVDLHWRTSQKLPSLFRKIARLIESVLLGPAEFRATVTRVDRLEQRSYPMLLASFEVLDLSVLN